MIYKIHFSMQYPDNVDFLVILNRVKDIMFFTSVTEIVVSFT